MPEIPNYDRIKMTVGGLLSYTKFKIAPESK